MTDEAQEPAGLRPSRIREVQAGATSWTTVDVVDVESALGGPLRSALETSGIRVERTPVGQGRHLDGATVMATGCDPGHPALVRAVLDCGAAASVAPDGAPFGCAGFFVPVFLSYELTGQRSLAEAVQRLGRPDRELGTWPLPT